MAAFFSCRACDGCTDNLASSNPVSNIKEYLLSKSYIWDKFIEISVFFYHLNARLKKADSTAKFNNIVKDYKVGIKTLHRSILAILSVLPSHKNASMTYTQKEVDPKKLLKAALKAINKKRKDPSLNAFMNYAFSMNKQKFSKAVKIAQRSYNSASN